MGGQVFSVDEALRMAIQFHRRGEFTIASDIYDDILKAVPNSADALHYKGLIQHEIGESEVAIELIGRALELTPVYPAALNNLGNILRECGRLEEARERYRQVLDISPEHVDTLVNIGVVHNGLRETAEAFECLTKALEIDPEHAVAWHNLGNVYNQRKLYAEAQSAFEKSAELAPDNTKSVKEIAKILYKSGKKKEAIETLERLLEQKSDDEIARHMIAAFGGAELPDRATDQFVTQTFDSFAGNFDETLARLEYKAPQLVADELKRLTGPDREIDVLDIGCGTGLCGPMVRPFASTLVGVDLSAGMIRKARLRKTYDELHEAELTDFMQKSAATYDAIICVDTFVYFGRLDEALVAATSILNSGGHLVFTVERHTRDESADDFRLQHHGRYSHVDEYIERVVTAAGLVVESLTPVVPRLEYGEPVAGMLVVARKNDD